MEERYQHLQARFRGLVGDHTPPWGLATQDDFVDLAERYGLRYPPSFVLFQTRYAAVLPPPDNAFRWVKRGLIADPECGHFDIEHAIQYARATGVPPRLAPFRYDEGNITGFDTGVLDASGESPVVFWEHDGPCEGREAADFIEWLTRSYSRRLKR